MVVLQQGGALIVGALDKLKVTFLNGFLLAMVPPLVVILLFKNCSGLYHAKLAQPALSTSTSWGLKYFVRATSILRAPCMKRRMSPIGGGVSSAPTPLQRYAVEEIELTAFHSPTEQAACELSPNGKAQM